MSLIACGSIRQGHERFILVMNLEEGKRFLCVWLVYYVSNLPIREWSQVPRYRSSLLHGDHFLLRVFSSSFLKS